MNLWRNADLPTFRENQLAHTTLADLYKGTYTMEVWRDTLAPGAQATWQRHACEKIVLVLAGRGECRSPRRRLAFDADSTLLIGADEPHQLANTGDAPLELLQVLGMTPVTTHGLDRKPLAPPWDATLNPLSASGATT